MFKFSTILAAIGHFFTGAFTKVLPALETAAQAELSTVEASLVTFATTDLGKLAIDAVSAASALSGGTNSTMFAAAKAQFIADAKTAGHDLSTIGLGVVDWMIQTAYTFSVNVITATQTAK
jgi:hypothetical protein